MSSTTPFDFDKPVESELEALNIMVSLINLAQSRGAYTLQESAKLWDCIKQFQNKDSVNNELSKTDNT
jgi:hypothetical protein